MYTPVQQQLLEFAREKTRLFCDANPVPVHGFDHAERVAQTAREIAVGEGVENVFLCELAAVLHDIGRVPEKYVEGNTKSHHELSYELLKQWFVDERAFDVLTDSEKIEILYAVRNHWCDGADDYVSAIILRDADKIDMFGERGLSRGIEWFENDPAKIGKWLIMVYYCRNWVRTKTAQKIIVENKLMDPVNEYFLKNIRSKITEVEL